MLKLKMRLSFCIWWILLFGFMQLQNYCSFAQEFTNSTDNTDNTNRVDRFQSSLKSNSTQYLFGIDPIPIDVLRAWGIPGVRDDDDFENWQPPPEITKNFPYYLSGFDKENHPIWISEWGRYDIKQFVIAEKKTQEVFEKYTRQAAYIAIKSRSIQATKENPVNRHIFFIDFEGLQPAQIANPAIIDYSIRLARKYRRFFEKNMHKMVILNVNFVAETIINLARPLFGRILDRIESYGTDKANYVPQLLKNFPKDQLPEWYGGEKEHKPIYVFG